MPGNWKVPDLIVHRTMLDFDANVAMPWHVADYSIDKLIWPLIPSGQEIIGLVDTGISQSHFQAGQLKGKVIDVRDFTGSAYGPWDANGHGSHTAGIMVANDFGVARTCAKLLSAKALGDDGSGSDEGIAAAIDWCVHNGAKLINLSLGSEFPSPQINAAVQRAVLAGAWVVFAAGNSSGPVEYPAKDWGGISAIGRDRQLASFSCFGAEVYATAPGVQITSLSRGGGYAVLSGTSMAAPWLTGMLACKRAFDAQRGVTPPVTRDEWINWLGVDSDDLGVLGRDARFGVGVLNSQKFAQIDSVPPQPGPSQPVPALPGKDIGIAVTTDGVNWFRVPQGTKLVPIKVAA